jgi:hypothetical protein
MEPTKMSRARKTLKFLKWFFIILIAVYLVAGISRGVYLFIKSRNDAKTAVEVEKIHNTKLTLDDVMGKNLPPDPGALADKTIAGVDANNNGIRDDVELAIFNVYPNSAKTRAVLLQYALALQMETIQPFVNTSIADSVIGKESRAGFCIADVLVPRKSPESVRSETDMEKINTFSNFVENKQFNNDIRKKAHEDFYNNMGNFANSTEKEECDLDSITLPN